MVTIESGTIQVYQGVRYYKCGHYFQRKGKRLHRVVWESLHGPIPTGMHVHHKDGDQTNNQPNNLDLMSRSSHLSQHRREPACIAAMQKHMAEVMQPKAAEWHSSEAGRAWHSTHALKTWAEQVLFDAICQTCGETFKTPRPTLAKFCRQNCKAYALRRRRGLREVKTPHELSR